MAGSFRQPDVTRYHGLEDAVAEEVLKVIADLMGEVGSVVEHRKQDALDSELGAVGAANAVQRIHQLRNAFQGKVFTLNGYQHRVGSHKRVQSKQVKGGRAVEEQEVKGVAQGRKLALKHVLAALLVRELEVGAHQVLLRRDQA